MRERGRRGEGGTAGLQEKERQGWEGQGGERGARSAGRTGRTEAGWLCITCHMPHRNLFPQSSADFLFAVATNSPVAAAENQVHGGGLQRHGPSAKPVRMSEMFGALGGVMGRPSWLPVPEFALKVIIRSYLVHRPSSLPFCASAAADHTPSLHPHADALPFGSRDSQSLLGEGAGVVLDGQKVLPSRAQQAGFSFKYRDVGNALQSIMSR